MPTIEWSELEPSWSYKSTDAVTISSDTKYIFGFTGWTVPDWGEWVDDLDPFEVFVRETRKEAGLEVPPPRQKWVPKSYSTGQVLVNATISIPSPKFHHQLRNWSSETDDRIGQTESDNDSVHTADE